MALQILINRKLVTVPRAFGWVPDIYDPRDLEFSVFNTPVIDTAITDSDNRPMFKEVSDQFSLPSCTANAGADAFEAALIKALVDIGMPLEEAKSRIPDLSRMFGWYWGRSFMDPSRTTDATSGCFNRLIMEVIARFGLPPETLWPYDNAILPPYNKPRPVVRPSISAQRAALKYRSNKFFSIPSDDKYKLIEGIDKALAAGHNVVWGTVVGSTIMKYEGGVATVPWDRSGRHAMVLCGKQGTNYWNRNSWSRDWGLGGYCLVSQEYITWNESSSFWFLVPEAVQ